MRAVELALALMAAPQGFAEVHSRPLPLDVLAAIKSAAGDAATLREEASRYRSSEAQVREACTIFVQRVLLAEGENPFRTLGCTAHSDDELLRQHYRWLQRWLHPDRDPEGWVSVFADRVNAAWNALRGERARHAMRRRFGAEPVVPRVARRPAPAALVPEQEPWAPHRWWTYLPHAVVASAVAVAVAVFWADQHFGRSEPFERQTPATTIEPLATRVDPASKRLAIAPTREAVNPPADARPEPESDVVVVPTRPPAVAARSTPPSVIPAEVTVPGGMDETEEVTPTPIAEPAPAALGPEVQLPPAAPPFSVLLAFSGAYQRGDATALMRLFTADAVTPSGDWISTRREYERLFAGTEDREFALFDLSWTPDGEGWIASARADIRLQHRTGQQERRYGEHVVVRLQPRVGTQRIVAWEYKTLD